MKRCISLAVGLLLVGGSVSFSQDVDVVGGQTSVLLDTGLLSSAAGLDLSGVSSDVGTGSLGGASVAFDINPRSAAARPTTFSFTAGDFTPFAGTIEHTGSVFFNMDSIEVGNFAIGFDANRVAGDNSGFFVESTTGISAILFDVGLVTELNADSSGLLVAGSLLVSPEFASFLGDTGLTGADVGDTAVEANAIPEPTATLCVSALAILTGLRRRRSQVAFI